MRNRQTQIDAADAVSTLSRAMIRAHRSPPRPVNIGQLWMAMYRGKVLKVLLLASVSGALFAITFYQSGSAAGLWFLRLFSGFTVLLAVFGPG